MEIDRRYLTRVIAMANGKGGVGKTSLCCHLGAQCAASGLRTLIVDLDVQGNTAEDLGYVSDGGQAMVSALLTGVPPQPVSDVRPGLDVIGGGPQLYGVPGAVTGLRRSGVKDAVHTRLAQVLAPLAAQYDVVLLDCPPGIEEILQLALGAASFVIIPTKMDKSSILGMTAMAELFVDARETNPQLDLLGIVVFDVPTSATTVLREAREEILAALGTDEFPVFEQSIRSVHTVARKIRNTGRLAHELEALAVDARAVRGLKPLDGHKPAGSVSSLAGDYAALAGEIVPLFTAKVQILEGEAA